MIGIIYKFTIIAKYKMDGHHPFYIGQHWCKSKEDFLDRNYPYYGSGTIWNDFIAKIKQEYPERWRYFIRREILCCVTNEENQKTLDKLEEYWIKRECSHYSFHLGGCNVLWGTANRFSSGSPSKQSFIRNKISVKINEWYLTEDGINFKKKLSKTKRRKLSEEIRKRMKIAAPKGENSYWFGKHLSEDTRKLIASKARERYRDPDYKKMVRDRTVEAKLKKKKKI